MAEHCRVCMHPEIALINRMMGKGTALSVLARRFDISEDGMSRHRADHVEKVTFSKGVDPESLLRDLIQAKNTAELTLTTATDPALKLRAIREMRITAESIAKLTGAFRAMDRRVMLPLWSRVKQTLITALKDHPDAREAVLRALETAQADMDAGNE